MFNQPIERVKQDCARFPLSEQKLCPTHRFMAQHSQCHKARYAKPLYRVAIYTRGEQEDMIQQLLHCQLALGVLVQQHPVLTYLYTDPDVLSLPVSMCMEEPYGLWALTEDACSHVFDMVMVNALDRLTDGKPTLYEEVVDYLLDAGLTILTVEEGCLFGADASICLNPKNAPSVPARSTGSDEEV